MVCSQCHTPNFRDYKYCRECGNRLEAAEAAGPVDEHAEVEQLLQHAFTQMDQGELEKALGTVQAALARDPENPSAHAALGLVYERQGLVQDAIHQFRVVLQLSPDSAADREKLQQLLARGGRESAGTFFTPTRLAVASAIAAGIVTLGVGLAVAGNRPAKASGSRQRAGTLMPTTALSPQTPVKPQPATPAAPPAPGTLKPVTPGPQTAIRPPAPRYAPPPTSAPLALMPVFSSPRQESRPTPPAPWQPRTQTGSTGLQAAKIGEVVPLSRPDFSPTPAAPERPTQPVSEPQTRPQPKPKVEPLEPETGFIRIEPVARPVQPQGSPSAGPAPAQPAPAPENPRPSISITISPGSR